VTWERAVAKSLLRELRDGDDVRVAVLSSRSSFDFAINTWLPGYLASQVEDVDAVIDLTSDGGVVILDLADADGSRWLDELRERELEAPFVIISAEGGPPAVAGRGEVVLLGPVRVEELGAAIEAARHSPRRRSQVRPLELEPVDDGAQPAWGGVPPPEPAPPTERPSTERESEADPTADDGRRQAAQPSLLRRIFGPTSDGVAAAADAATDAASSEEVVPPAVYRSEELLFETPELDVAPPDRYADIQEVQHHASEPVGPTPPPSLPPPPATAWNGRVPPHAGPGPLEIVVRPLPDGAAAHPAVPPPGGRDEDAVPAPAAAEVPAEDAGAAPAPAGPASETAAPSSDAPPAAPPVADPPPPGPPVGPPVVLAPPTGPMVLEAPLVAPPAVVARPAEAPAAAAPATEQTPMPATAASPDVGALVISDVATRAWAVLDALTSVVRDGAAVVAVRGTGGQLATVAGMGVAPLEGAPGIRFDHPLLRMLEGTGGAATSDDTSDGRLPLVGIPLADCPTLLAVRFSAEEPTGIILIGRSAPFSDSEVERAWSIAGDAPALQERVGRAHGGDWQPPRQPAGPLVATDAARAAWQLLDEAYPLIADAGCLVAVRADDGGYATVAGLRLASGDGARTIVADSPLLDRLGEENGVHTFLARTQDRDITKNLPLGHHPAIAMFALGDPGEPDGLVVAGRSRPFDAAVLSELMAIVRDGEHRLPGVLAGVPRLV
jgi:hypothetical protein